jgi:hypothetical protein
MVRTKAGLARRLTALKVGYPLYDFGFLLPRLFGRDGELDKRGLKAARAFAAQHDCVLSYPEFTREPVMFEKLSADGLLTPEAPPGRRRPRRRRTTDGMSLFFDDRRVVEIRGPARRR